MTTSSTPPATPVEATTPDQVLDRAADVIENRGLHKRAYTADPDNPAAPVCALGAINVAVYGDPRAPWFPNTAQIRLVRDARLLLVEHLGYGTTTLSAFEGAFDVIGNQWNDWPERTAEQVVTTLRAAAAGAR